MKNTGPITQNDLERLTLYITKEFAKLTERLEDRIDKRLSNLRYWVIGGLSIFCIVFSWIFDYKFDFTNSQHQAQIEKLDAAVFVPQHEAILRAIQDIKDSMDEDREKRRKRRFKK